MPPSVTTLKFPFKTPPKGVYITPEFNRNTPILISFEDEAALFIWR